MLDHTREQFDWAAELGDWLREVAAIAAVSAFGALIGVAAALYTGALR